MSDVRAQRQRAGGLAVAAAAMSLLTVPLYFQYPGAPPDWNILTRVLLGAVGSILILLFLTAWWQYLATVAPESAWTAASSMIAGATWVALTLVHLSMEAGTAISSRLPIDPTQDGAVTPAQFLLQGSIGRLLVATFLICSVTAAAGSEALPPTLRRAGYVVAAIQLAFVPSLYFGPDSADFYSAVGWGTTAAAPGTFIVWLLATGLALRSPAPNNRSSPLQASNPQ